MPSCKCRHAPPPTSPAPPPSASPAVSCGSRRTAQTGTCTAPSSVSAQSCGAQGGEGRAVVVARERGATPCMRASSLWLRQCQTAAALHLPAACQQRRRLHACRRQPQQPRLTEQVESQSSTQAHRWPKQLQPAPDKAGGVEVEGEHGVALEQPAKHAGEARGAGDLHNQVVLNEPAGRMVKHYLVGKCIAGDRPIRLFLINLRGCCGAHGAAANQNQQPVAQQQRQQSG